MLYLWYFQLVYLFIIHFSHTSQTYEYFVKRTQAIAHSQGRDVVGWEEIWNHFGTSLAKSTIIHQVHPLAFFSSQLVYVSPIMYRDSLNEILLLK